MNIEDVPQEIKSQIIQEDQRARMGAVIDLWSKWEKKYNIAIEALKQIARMDTHPISCPDNKPGCCVDHWGPGKYGKEAVTALETIEELDKKGILDT